MKYEPHTSLFRFHTYNHHQIFVCKRDTRCEYYIDGIYMWTKATGKNGYRLKKDEIEFGSLNKYNDWVEFSQPPNYIPDGQQFNWYLLKWEKQKNEV